MLDRNFVCVIFQHTMHKCRICLLSKSNVRQITELHEDISYASMLTYVADIKVVEGNNQFICHLCSQKLRDSYFFRLLIIRSNRELNVNCKVFKFDSIKDVKAQILKKNYTKPNNRQENNNKTLIESQNNYTFHNDIVIQRLESSKMRLASINILDTDNEAEEDTSVISEANEENNYDCEINKDKDIEIEKEVDKKSDKIFKKQQSVKNVLIKPKYLEGLRMIPSISKRIKIPVQRPVQQTTAKRVKREDICPYCGIKTKSMKTHLLIHTVSQKFECNDCARKFYTKSNLEHHIKSHFNEHIYRCEKCVATFNTKGGLKSHLHIHIDAKDYKCHICNKAFRWRSGLHRHILIHNINAKPVRCEVCNMSFLNKYALKVHTRVHTGERPYNCELCSKPYSYKRDFNRHCLSKHGVLLDRRSVYIMNEETLKKEKVLMKDLMLRVHGIPTEREPLDSFKGPQKALAFAKAVKAMQDLKVPIDVQL